ncbi:PAS domain-containing protein [Flavobacterium suncheonense]|uniref:Histidine kinase n=1 Tax=Flavobacterium suncheonense GH29-5 = DSM 17707 TaxID=1121899 RepID=A0A0A2MGM9_9FLAO|nr:PAS domain-containing protein [Flavobacterium suncheonense]KGO90726.1 histidine kinase [Flavobacterium suncheonense GH29-5 = DSM 17707]
MEVFERPVPIDKEVSWDKTKTIMSKTDRFGTIEYANEVFIDVSGYEDYELMSQPHNIIRHPDMPKVIFKVLWDNLKKGNNFHAIVKNLAKSGRYYWVITDFDISKDEKGNIVNYFARRKAVPQEVITKHIEPLYKRLLQIENASGMEASEKYLIGYLEEQNKNYVEFIMEIMSEHEKSVELQNAAAAATAEVKTEDKKGFFSKFFG